jgi:CRISPR/Cas system CMR-associated protein Cmr5 small subunit
MQNLEQIRAAKALSAAQQKQGSSFRFVRSDVAGFPALIMQNGLLAAFAYAAEGEKEARTGIHFACNEAAEHLANEVHGISVLKGKHTAKEVTEALCHHTASSIDLQRATAEALAFFSYLKRFAAKNQPHGEPLR